MLAVLVLTASTVAAYAVALGSPFQLDDRPLAEALMSGAPLTIGGLRPLLKASYVVSRFVSTEPWSFRLGNLVIHLVNVALVLSLARQLRLGQLATWVSAGLFALHPIQTEAVTYVSGRSAALSATFMLLALSARTRGERSGQALMGELVSLAMLVLAVFTKETSVVLLAAFVLWDLIVERKGLRDVWQRHVGWALVGLLVFAVFLWHPSYFRLLYETVGQRSFADAVTYQLAGMAYVASRLVLLGRPCIDPGLWDPPSVLSVLTGAVVVAACVAISVTERRRRPVLSFGALWFLLHAFLPYVLVSRTDVINERHVYAANVGLFLGVGAGVEAWASRSRPRLVEVVASAVAVLLFVQTVRRNLEYLSEVSLWESTTREAPRNPRAFHNLGVAYERESRLASAVRAYTKALELEPRYEAPRESLARIRASGATR